MYIIQYYRKPIIIIIIMIVYYIASSEVVSCFFSPEAARPAKNRFDKTFIWVQLLLYSYKVERLAVCSCGTRHVVIMSCTGHTAVEGVRSGSPIGIVPTYDITWICSINQES